MSERKVLWSEVKPVIAQFMPLPPRQEWEGYRVGDFNPTNAPASSKIYVEIEILITEITLAQEFITFSDVMLIPGEKDTLDVNKIYGEYFLNITDDWELPAKCVEVWQRIKELKKECTKELVHG